MIRITILFGKNAASFVEWAALAQIGYRESLQNAGEWVLPVPDVNAATSHFELTNVVMSKCYPYSLTGSCPDAASWVDLHWRLEMCIGCFVVVEVAERERLLFRQIWLENADDVSMLKRSQCHYPGFPSESGGVL